MKKKAIQVGHRVHKKVKVSTPKEKAPYRYAGYLDFSPANKK